MHGHEITGSDATMGTFVSLFSLVIAYVADASPTLHTVALVAATFSGLAAGVYHCVLVVDALRKRRKARV